MRARDVEDSAVGLSRTSNGRIEYEVPACFVVDKRIACSNELSKRLFDTFLGIMGRRKSVRSFHDQYRIHANLRLDSKNIKFGCDLRTGQNVVIKVIDKEMVRNVLTVEDTVIPTEVVLHVYVAKLLPTSGILTIVDFCELDECWMLVMPYSDELVDLHDYIYSPPQRTNAACPSTDSSSSSSSSLSSLSAFPHAPLHSINDDVSWNIFRQLLHINADLTRVGVVHRDIKIENILLNVQSMQICLIDFGASAIIQERDFTDFYGTPAYRTPEFILNRRYAAIPSTVWTIGVVLFDLINGYLPFEVEDDILRAHSHFRKGVSEKLKEIILSCLKVNPDERPDIETLIRS